jgi:septum formation protein
MISTYPLILGSSSPRRSEILQFFSLPFTKKGSDFPEESILFSGDPTEYVTTLAKEKGRSLQKIDTDRAILTADTVVYFKGKVYNKPKDRKEAISFLEELSNNWHSVYTALCLSFEDKQYVQVEKTEILFHPLTSTQISHYLDHINFLDKAGGYAIQQGGSILVKEIKGCYYNVMGLPIHALKQLLLHIGIDLWEHLKIL